MVEVTEASPMFSTEAVVNFYRLLKASIIFSKTDVDHKFNNLVVFDSFQKHYLQ